VLDAASVGEIIVKYQWWLGPNASTTSKTAERPMLAGTVLQTPGSDPVLRAEIVDLKVGDLVDPSFGEYLALA
jgi:hypothetical protein